MMKNHAPNQTPCFAPKKHLRHVIAELSRGYFATFNIQAAREVHFRSPGWNLCCEKHGRRNSFLAFCFLPDFGQCPNKCFPYRFTMPHEANCKITAVENLAVSSKLPAAPFKITIVPPKIAIASSKIGRPHEKAKKCNKPNKSGGPNIQHWWSTAFNVSYFPGTSVSACWHASQGRWVATQTLSVLSPARCFLLAFSFAARKPCFSDQLSESSAGPTYHSSCSCQAVFT